MTPLNPYWGLPDPDTHAEFYADTSMKRFVAWIVDTVVILLISIIAIPFTAFVGLFFFAGLFTVVSLIYRIVTIANWSATPGMMLMAIEFRNNRGERFDLGTATLHTILFNVMSWLFVLQFVSIILMMTGARGQGLHDLVLGTAAINRAAAQFTQ